MFFQKLVDIKKNIVNSFLFKNISGWKTNKSVLLSMTIWAVRRISQLLTQ